MNPAQGLRLIGKGAFSTVYKKSDKEVLIKSLDPVKECMSSDSFPNTRLFPKTVFVDNDYYTEHSWYTQPLFQKHASLKSSIPALDWEFYNLLRGVAMDVFTDHRYELYKRIKKLSSKFRHRKHVLLEAMDALGNFGWDLRMEVSPRNVAVHKGRLVLLDIFFFKEVLDRVKPRRW